MSRGVRTSRRRHRGGYVIYLDIAVLVIAIFVVLILLSTMREVALLQEKVSIYRQLLLRPARPSFIGDQIPVDLQSALERLVPLRGATDALLLFIRADCTACRELVGKLIEQKLSSKTPIVCIVGLGSRGRRMSDRLADAGYVSVHDSDEALFDAAEVRSTPTTIMCNLVNKTATEHSEGSDLEWIRSLVSDATAARTTSL